MRHILYVAFVAAFVTSSRAADEAETPVETVRFGSQSFELAWKIESASNNMKEFIPKGESLRNWKSFVGVYEYPLIDDPRAFAYQMSQSIKHQNPRAQSSMTYDAQKGIAMLDFVTWPVDARFIEYNVFKFERDESKGIVGYQYAVRDYDDKKAFFANLETLRKQSLKTMSEEGVVVQSAAPSRETASTSSETSHR